MSIISEMISSTDLTITPTNNHKNTKHIKIMSIKNKTNIQTSAPPGLAVSLPVGVDLSTNSNPSPIELQPGLNQKKKKTKEKQENKIIETDISVSNPSSSNSPDSPDNLDKSSLDPIVVQQLVAMMHQIDALKGLKGFAPIHTLSQEGEGSSKVSIQNCCEDGENRELMVSTDPALYVQAALKRLQLADREKKEKEKKRQEVELEKQEENKGKRHSGGSEGVDVEVKVCLQASPMYVMSSQCGQCATD